MVSLSSTEIELQFYCNSVGIVNVHDFAFLHGSFSFIISLFSILMFVWIHDFGFRENVPHNVKILNEALLISYLFVVKLRRAHSCCVARTEANSSRVFMCRRCCCLFLPEIKALGCAENFLCAYHTDA